MSLELKKFLRKPLQVEGVQVTEDNMDELSEWCQGEVRVLPDKKTGGETPYIHVRVHHPLSPRQTRAFVGDYILYANKGYKVYTNKALKKSFDEVEANSTERV